MTELGYPYTKPRCPIGAMYTSPGPVYMLPPLIGDKNHDLRSTHPKAPAYSLGRQWKDISIDRSPGPAAYAQNGKFTNVGEAASPRYTITGIQKPLKFGEGPGPADYNVDPGKKLVYPGVPAYPMGVRLRARAADDTPAPNAYTLPNPSKRSEIHSAPRYTLAGRSDSATLILNKNPGPADYSVGSTDIYLQAAPKFTMGSTIREMKRAEVPGPLNYKVEKVTAHLPSMPKFTMGIKHSQYKGEFALTYEDG